MESPILNLLLTLAGIAMTAGALWLAMLEWYRGTTERGLEAIRLTLDTWHREWRELNRL